MVKKWIKNAATKLFIMLLLHRMMIGLKHIKYGCEENGINCVENKNCDENSYCEENIKCEEKVIEKKIV